MERPSFQPEALPNSPIVDSPGGSDSFLIFEPKNEAQAKAAQLIEQGVDKLLSDPKSYFRFASKFHTYSVNNSLLIMMQRPDATKVASMKRWNDLGRHVIKGEHGLKIFFPLFAFREQADEETGELKTVKVLSGFGVGNTFDVSQTDGADLPPEPTIIQSLGITEGAKDVDRRLSSYLAGESVRLAKLPLGSARGMFSGPAQTVALNIELPFGEILTTKTLMHEASHWAADHRGGDKRDLETVAEASAFIAMSHFGMDTSEYSFGYVTHWAQDMSRLRQNLGAAQKISHQLITAVDGEKPETMPEWL